MTELIMRNFRFVDMDTGKLIRRPTANEMHSIDTLIQDTLMECNRETLVEYAQRVTGNSDATLEWS